MALFGAVLLVFSALITHVTIGRPGIELGRHFAIAAAVVRMRARALVPLPD
jgi:hypothetical protein